MKNKFLLFAFLFILIFSSCESEQQPIKESENENLEIEIKEDTSIKEEVVEVIKPTTAEEIIELADTFNVDTSMTAFSLDSILTDSQLMLTDDAGDEYQNSTAYLGDSVTLGLSFFKNHPSELVIAKGSINPLDAVDKNLIELDDGTFVNFPEALKLTGAKRAVLTFGSNAISIMSEETFLKYYIKLIDSIKEVCPDCEIIIQSITPLATTCTLKKLTNTLINRANLLLLSMCYSKDLKFLNSAPSLKDENGYLKIEYCSSDDGIHINEEGYKVWINELRTHAITE